MIRLILFVLLAPLCAMAQPKPGAVQQGTATFSAPGNTLTVTNTPGSIINWSSFSISKEAAPNYIQSPSAPTQLNRVPESRLVVPIGGTLITAPSTVPAPQVQVQPPAMAPASASQAVQLPDGRIVFRTTQQ